MKLKYYLRTLGIGIFVTTLMLMISSGFHKMTDEQVIQRAKELGMVDTKNQVLADLREEQNEKPSTEQSANMPGTDDKIVTEPSGTDSEEQIDSMENERLESLETQESSSPEETEESSQPESIVETSEPQEPSTQESDVTQETETNETENAEQTVTQEFVEITIVRGDSSDSVSQKLYRAGLVSSAAEYDRYLCRNKYDYSISIGTYQIPIGSSEEQIAKIITRK